MKNAKKGWSKGFNKFTHPSIKKISETMRKKRIDNFFNWREEMRKAGKIKSSYPNFRKDENLSELIGVVLGDGNIEKFPRTERLIIAANSRNTGFIKRYSELVKLIFEKDPVCMTSKKVNCTRISIYEKFISKRLGVPSGDRSSSNKGIPGWAWKNKKFLIGCLRGLYEAEGSFTIHKPTSTYKAAFSNKNPKLLNDVFKALQKLGFSPLYEKHRIMISKKKEFYELKDIIKFRDY